MAKGKRFTKAKKSGKHGMDDAAAEHSGKKKGKKGKNPFAGLMGRK